jgi:hypothetical protein
MASPLTPARQVTKLLPWCTNEDPNGIANVFGALGVVADIAKHILTVSKNKEIYYC